MSRLIRDYSEHAKSINESCRLRGGEGGIRTHVPGLPGHLISSQRRYGHFGTSPIRVVFYQRCGPLRLLRRAVWDVEHETARRLSLREIAAAWHRCRGVAADITIMQ